MGTTRFQHLKYLTKIQSPSQSRARLQQRIHGNATLQAQLLANHAMDLELYSLGVRLFCNKITTLGLWQNEEVKAELHATRYCDPAVPIRPHVWDLWNVTAMP